ncbi:MAG: DUF547 domain-containing protein [Bacteriovoracaceae bacterium]|nr:DUF547 domain-containing protein [Bacteriovoracaceae bacterium]
MKIKVFTLLMSLTLALASGCQSKKEPQIGAPKKVVSVTEEVLEDKEVDIIVPEISISENAEYLSKDIFDLWDLFFQSFVPVVSENPFDSRVNFKSMHQLRSSRDKDFLDLVSIIEKKMASTDVSKMEREERAAFYINAYNYSAIRLVNKGFIKDGEMISSIKDLSKNFYSLEILIRDAIQFYDGIKSLDQIMKKEIRPLFSKDGKVTDARFYFLLNGATLGRAILLNQAVRVDTLEAQLSFASKNALKVSRYADIEGDTLKVSRLFKWYKDDFEEAYETLENFFTENGIERSSYKKIRYQEFQWEINDAARFPGVIIAEPKQPLPQIISEEEEVIPTKPCDYLVSDKVKVLGYCNQVIDGRLSGGYPYKVEVLESKLCLYTRDLGDGKRSLGINGNIVEIQDESNNRESLTLTVEDKLKEKKDVLQMRIAEGVRTFLEYLQTDRRLTVRQTSVLPGKGYRKFLLQCE